MNSHEQHTDWLAQQYQQNLQVYANVTAPVIVTNEDKVRLVLNELRKTLTEAKAWIGPLGIFLTLVATLITADFRELFGVKPDVWKGVYYCITLLIVVWLLRTWRASKEEMTDDEFVRKLKNASTKVSDAALASHYASGPAWIALLEAQQWSLEFRPGVAKDMQFVRGGGILGGRNNNEHTWRVENGLLELVEVDGRTVHSRFAFDESKTQFFQTKDSDTPKASGQILRIKP
jgi:hypothetical protein